MSMVGFPLLLIPLAIYNIIVWLMPDVSLGATLITLPLVSGAQWPVTLSDVLLALGILMLLLEVIKGARPGAKFLTDHLLSLILFGGAVAEFLLWPRFANSTYFLLTLLALTDFLSGVSLRMRRASTVATVRQGARPMSVEVRQEPTDLHPGVIDPSISAPSEPTFDHSGAAAAAHPSEVSSAGSHAGGPHSDAGDSKPPHQIEH
jgi:hypothetical protein